MDDDWREDGSLRGLNARGSKQNTRKGKGPQFTRVIPKFLQKYHQPPAIEAKFTTLPEPGGEDEGLDEVQQAAIDEYLTEKKKKDDKNLEKACIGVEENNDDLRKRNGQTIVQLGKAKATNRTKSNKRKRGDQPTLSNKKLLSFSIDDE
ncbi:uncharacterized protein PHALS_02800 [Plasmopara halstedii]|uniref:DUF4604 domain-containing protein n=1 Tax=Plasmopara halstedii TaxID=4781 RepID=A0A0P1AZT6_PLAHL|nr:uncharacterized protein PHALS_02800 [Plasmopara halstedii]CEG46397.1 hypothetical protein PHALS_02800 [Plasmopara halstedii]|eukprot:XP_024582766.1 hypothetical protein PHALS_02800 [Plasmopara halstedii]